MLLLLFMSCLCSFPIHLTFNLTHSDDVSIQVTSAAFKNNDNKVARDNNTLWTFLLLWDQSVPVTSFSSLWFYQDTKDWSVIVLFWCFFMEIESERKRKWKKEPYETTKKRDHKKVMITPSCHFPWTTSSWGIWSRTLSRKHRLKE